MWELLSRKAPTPEEKATVASTSLSNPIILFFFSFLNDTCCSFPAAGERRQAEGGSVSHLSQKLAPSQHPGSAQWHGESLNACQKLEGPKQVPEVRGIYKGSAALDTMDAQRCQPWACLFIWTRGFWSWEEKYGLSLVRYRPDLIRTLHACKMHTLEVSCQGHDSKTTSERSFLPLYSKSYKESFDCE